jgi:Mrp family chromosome partitioning ATPase
MARILDIAPPITSKTPRAEAVKYASETCLPNEDTVEEADIPFVEVGAGITGTSSRIIRRRSVEPTIIPMPQSRVPVNTPAKDEVAQSKPIYRIAFQPLPFPEPSSKPPKERFAPELVVFHQPDHEVSRQYQGVVTQMEQQLQTSVTKSLLFTSALPDAGTTSVVVNLALAHASSEDKPTLLVDANFERPAISERLGLTAEPGLREILARTVPLAWGIKDSGLPNLRILTAGQRSGPVIMDLWPIVLDQLVQQYHWVLIDGPLIGSSAWSALAGTVAATYFVLKQADLEKPELNQLLQGVAQAGAKLRGYVLTHCCGASSGSS